jgi:hypothetical protein
MKFFSTIDEIYKSYLMKNGETPEVLIPTLFLVYKIS